ncbi:4'-phosphopantetheinyl transferase family protein [Chryseobacterium potabilaquae]|uniref:4'-phosphopantetheinyl transferase sfp n=1 Tax=Chryseobacterium potabilaquae TaxID=2675057 RepID=A0A6N4XF41_9FLAO|nr:4'-phosphopantetheinyl transferase superfamily protein [Chryseobacterium potabilaquae]CAA7197570.1 4'-phosphopantetheinyl transferase sfp [Chryseobacterium potabilaquae]
MYLITILSLKYKGEAITINIFLDMTLIYWTDFSESDFDLFFSICHHRLTPEIFKKQMMYKKRESALCFLLGRLLLWYGMNDFFGDNKRLTIRFKNNQKPYFENGPFFNISHSGRQVACAINNDFNIGMDLEKIEPISYTEFYEYFTASEQEYITHSTSPISTFYKLWTKKEAFIKADGRGLEIPLNSFNTLENTLYFNSQYFILKELNFSSGYFGHFALMDGRSFSDNSSDHISHFIPVEELLRKLETFPFLLSDLN